MRYMLTLHEYIKLTFSLFTITTPLAAATLYLTIIKNRSLRDQNIVMLSSISLYCCIMVFLTFFGEQVLQFFSISIHTFKVVGGILLIVSAIDMLKNNNKSVSPTGTSKPFNPFSWALIPLGVPMLAGPGAISTIIVYTSMGHSLDHKILMVGVILTSSILLLLLFWLTKKFGCLINTRITNVVNRLMGLIIAALGVEFIFSGSMAHITDHL